MRKSKLEISAKKLRSRKKLKWDNKDYYPGDLIIHLAREVRRLRKNQCKPGMHCFFAYYDHIDGIYGQGSGEINLLAFPSEED